MRYCRDTESCSATALRCRLGITRLNVYAGLAGFFMVRNSFPQNGPELPGIPYPPPGMGPDKAVRELPLAIQDRAFDIFNQLYYPKQTTLPAAEALPNGPVPPTWVPGEACNKRKLEPHYTTIQESTLSELKPASGTCLASRYFAHEGYAVNYQCTLVVKRLDLLEHQVIAQGVPYCSNGCPLLSLQSCVFITSCCDSVHS
jgi:hypothetical protein